jgi:hypothetical protein
MNLLFKATSALIAGIILSIFSIGSFAGGLHSSHAETDDPKKVSGAITHAPIGVMGDHMHGKGEFMMSYRFMRMDMEGNRIGSSRISAQDITGTKMAPGRFMVAPTSMPMNMHMLGAMYGLSEKVTLMGMVNFISNEMDHRMRNGNTFKTESEGLGDTKIAAMISLVDDIDFKVHYTLGLNIPTGSIDKRDDTPAMANAFLPYPMQLGSGTYDFLPAVTAVKYYDNRSFGAQASAEIRMGENDETYTLGDVFKLTAWGAVAINYNLSTSLRLSYLDRANIDGLNPALNPMMIQTANSNLQAVERIDLGLGLNYLFNNGHRLALEYSRAINQKVDGPQLETDSVITLGWQKAF